MDDVFVRRKCRRGQRWLIYAGEWLRRESDPIEEWHAAVVKPSADEDIPYTIRGSGRVGTSPRLSRWLSTWRVKRVIQRCQISIFFIALAVRVNYVNGIKLIIIVILLLTWVGPFKWTQKSPLFTWVPTEFSTIWMNCTSLDRSYINPNGLYVIKLEESWWRW